MNREETKKLLAERSEQDKVMWHFVDGGEVERSSIYANNWEVTNHPSWDWASIDYRIKRQLPEVGKWYDIPGIGKLKCIAYDTEFGIYYFTKGCGVAPYTDSYDFTEFKQVEP